MRDGVDQLADVADDVELFEDLAAQRFGMRLARRGPCRREIPNDRRGACRRASASTGTHPSRSITAATTTTGVISGADGADRHRLDPRELAVRLDHLRAHVAFIALERVARRRRRLLRSARVPCRPMN